MTLPNRAEEVLEGLERLILKEGLEKVKHVPQNMFPIGAYLTAYATLVRAKVAARDMSWAGTE
jgi:hypothetical protein